MCAFLLIFTIAPGIGIVVPVYNFGRLRPSEVWGFSRIKQHRCGRLV